MQQFGFIGLGIMGSAMAKNLLRGGFPVTIWNRTADKCAELVAMGAEQAPTPARVTAQCGITFAMLADPAAAEAVCFGHDGALDGIGAGRGYVDMSTVDDATAQRIAASVAARGGRYLEGPVSGSRKPAEDGTLIILAAGDRSLYDEALPGLEKMGKKILYLGDTGNGARMKLVVNMIMAGMSGSGTADAAGTGAVLIPAMRKAGYGVPFSAAIVGAAATIGPIIPPSIPFVIYGSMADVSVGRLFLAGALFWGILLSALAHEALHDHDFRLITAVVVHKKQERDFVVRGRPKSTRSEIQIAVADNSNR